MTEPTVVPVEVKPPSLSSVTDLVAHVRLTHHVNARVLLCRVDLAMGTVVEGRRDVGRGAAQEVRTAFTRMRAELLGHMAVEERAVFPYLRAIDAADRRLGHAPVEAFAPASPLKLAMQRAAEEELVARQLAGLAKVCAKEAREDFEPVVAALADLLQDLGEHSEFERDVLYPMGAEAELRVVSRAMRP